MPKIIGLLCGCSGIDYQYVIIFSEYCGNMMNALSSNAPVISAKRGSFSAKRGSVYGWQRQPVLFIFVNKDHTFYFE